MDKIPMGRTIGEAFDFALGRYWSILGVIWLPLLVLLTVEYLLIVPYLVRLFEFVQFAIQHPKAHPGPPPEIARLQGYIRLFDVFAVVVSIWMQVGIAKTALKLRTGPRFFYVPVDYAELRVIGAYLVFLAILIAIFVALGIAGGIVAGILWALVSGSAFTLSMPDWLKPWLAGGLAAFFAAIAALLIYVQVRLLDLLVPATVAEKRFALWRSWQLSKGNFWRIFVVGVGTLSPIFVFEFVLIFAFYILIFVTVIANAAILQRHGHAAHGPAQAAAFMGLLWRYVAVYGAVAGAVLVPLLPLAYGLRFSSSAFAYRALTEKGA